MKKTYVKPQLWTEAFQPADAIAGNCSINVGFGDGGSLGANMCKYDDGFDNILFVDAETSASPCLTGWNENDDGPCYHTAGDVVGMYFGS